jgi:hypothetical protein
MSRREALVLIDDLDGRVVRDGEGQTVTFGLDGTEYEIDLSTKNAASLRSALEPFVNAGRHSIGNGRPSTRPSVTRVDTATDPAAVRAGLGSRTRHTGQQPRPGSCRRHCQVSRLRQLTIPFPSQSASPILQQAQGSGVLRAVRHERPPAGRA